MNLIVGASGSLGGKIARRLMARGEPIRILVRPHSDYSQLEEAGAQVAFGDLKDPLSLPAAVEGVRRVVTTANTAGRGGDDNVETVDRRGTANLIAAAREVGVERFLYVSAAAADIESPVPFFRAKAENEGRLIESGLPYTIIQPELFMEIWIGAFLGVQLQQGPKVQLVGEGNKKVAFVAEGDVGAISVAALLDPASPNETLRLGGAVASYREIISMVERLTGTEIDIETLAPGQTIDRLPPAMQPTMTGLMTGLALGPDSVPVDHEVARRFGLEYTPLEEFLAGAFGRSVAAD